jgi:predicted transcriptional regulator of viral defense system
MTKTPIDRLVALAGEAGLLRPRDLASHGIARIYLALAVRRGLLTKVGRGLYARAEQPITEYASLTEASKRVPRGVLCLLTALRFHEIGTQNPADVWLAVRSKDRKPTVEHLRLRVVRFSERAMREGVEERHIGGVTVRVTNPARTVADCFKYRNKIGIDVAIEALRECCRMRLASPAQLADFAKANRVLSVIRPYLEALG